MSCLDVKGKCFSLKIKKRQENAPAPGKFLGCGLCDDISRSHTLEHYTNDPVVLMKWLWQLFSQIKCPVSEIRGIGITMSKLDNEEHEKSGLQPKLETYFTTESSFKAPVSPVVTKRKEKEEKSKKGKKLKTGNSFSYGMLCPVRLVQQDDLSLEDVDPDVLAALPKDLQNEILQNLPLEHNSLHVPGDNAAQQPTDPSTSFHLPVQQNWKDASLESLLDSHQFEQVPLKVEEMLEAGLQEIENHGKIHSSSIQGVLSNLDDWIRQSGDEEWETVVSVLKVVQRMGSWYPSAFEEHSQQFVGSVQSYVHQKYGYWLNLSTL